MSENIVNILHLTDLHFGSEGNNGHEVKNRKEVLELFKEEYHKMNDRARWKPNILAITGDIGWKGQNRDYEEAKEWIEDIIEYLEIRKKNVIFCAGNHDIDLTPYGGFNRPEHEEIVQRLTIDQFQDRRINFSGFENFCKDLGIEELDYEIGSNYLIGTREVEDVLFMVLNSSWNCWHDASDRGNLYIGSELLSPLRQKTSKLKSKPSKLTVSLIHHPESWLHETEYNEYNNRLPSYNFLAERSHVILSGHEHSRFKTPDLLRNQAFIFKGGATYADKDYRNNCAILRIDKSRKTINRKVFEYDPGREEWNTIEDVETYTLKNLVSVNGKKAKAEPVFLFHTYLKRQIPKIESELGGRGVTLKGSSTDFDLDNPYLAYFFLLDISASAKNRKIIKKAMDSKIPWIFWMSKDNYVQLEDYLDTKDVEGDEEYYELILKLREQYEFITSTVPDLPTEITNYYESEIETKALKNTRESINPNNTYILLSNKSDYLAYEPRFKRVLDQYKFAKSIKQDLKANSDRHQALRDELKYYPRLIICVGDSTKNTWLEDYINEIGKMKTEFMQTGIVFTPKILLLPSTERDQDKIKKLTQLADDCHMVDWTQKEDVSDDDIKELLDEE